MGSGRKGLDIHPLREIVAEASRALVQLDAERLEELALSCQALNRRLPESVTKLTPDPAQTRAAKREMATLGRILEVTRGNLRVLRQLRHFEQGFLEYKDAGTAAWPKEEARNGDN